MNVCVGHFNVTLRKHGVYFNNLIYCVAQLIIIYANDFNNLYLELVATSVK